MRVNVDEQALNDPRIKRLAKRLGVTHGDAFFACIKVWFAMYHKAGEPLSPEDIDAVSDVDGMAEGMIACELGHATEAGVRISGSERAHWVARNRESASAGGRTRAASPLASVAAGVARTGTGERRM